MLQNLARELAPYTWRKTPCTIRKAEIIKAAPESQHYHFSVSYDYDFDGNRFNNTMWRRADLQPHDSYSALTDQTGKYLIDPNSFCFVDPDHPERAVLQRENPARLLLLLIPFLVVFPAGMGLLRLRRPASGSERSNRMKTRMGMQLVALAVAGFGFFLFYIFFVRAVFDVIRAAAWEPSTCTVIDSYLYTDQTSLSSGSSNKRPGYRLRILFSYIYGGREFRADRYNFIRWGTGGQKQAKILRQYPAEARVPCYVNAGKPYEAVLNRNLSFGYFMGLLPLLIAAAGMILFFVASRMSTK